MRKSNSERKVETVYSIAEACNVSATTVSLALRDDPRLRPETRQRIQEYARKVHFRPNQLAQSLKRSSSGYIGLVLPSPTWWVDTLMLDELYRQAARERFDIQLQVTHDDLGQEARAVSRCLQGSVDGLILIASFEKESDLPEGYPLAELRERRLPTVIVGLGPDDFVRTRRDRAAAVELGTRHLVEQGYDRICLLLAVRSLDLEGTQYRTRRFASTLREMGRRYRTDDFYYRLSGFERLRSAADDTDGGKQQPAPAERLFFDYLLHGRYGYEMARDVLAETPANKSIGLVCGSDGIAAGVFRYCRENYLDVPGRIGVVGCDDTTSKDLDVTTCRWDHQRMCAMMLKSLRDQRQGRVTPQFIEQKPELIVRSSSLRAAASAPRDR